MIYFAFALILGVVVALPPPQCVTKFSGTLPQMAKKFPLPKVNMVARSARLTLGPLPCSYYVLELTVCDDAKADVYFRSNYIVEIYRRGSWPQAAEISGAYYCSLQYGGPKDVVPSFGLIFCIEAVLNFPIKKSYDVDEFCEKLLSSNKFEKLIEKVADKAVEKINDANHHIETDHFKKSNRAEKESDENETKKEKSEEGNVEAKKAKDLASKMSLIKNYSIAPLSDLSLQFKKFIKSSAVNTTNNSEETKIEKTAKSKEIKHHKKKHSDEVHHKKKHGKKHADKKEADKDKNTTIKDDNTSEESKGETSESSEIKVKSKEKDTDKKNLDMDKHFNSSSTKDTKESKKHKKEYSNEISKEIAVVKSDENHLSKEVRESDSEAKFEKDERSGEDDKSESKSREKNSYEGREYSNEDDRHDRAVKRSEGKEHEPERDEGDLEKNAGKSRKRAKGDLPVIRLEGDKVYTYQVSSEYDEYHEQLKKLEKHKKSKRKLFRHHQE